MTAPRQVVPGSTYMVTRRCSQRQFLLRPSETINAIFLYCLAFAAKDTGVQLHDFIVLSNHYHVVLTDVLGNLPEFMATLNRLVGKCVNTHLSRSESLWSSDHYSAVKLETEDDLWDKLLYVLTNPVAAGLVPSLSQWPGVKSAPRGFGAVPTIAKRPEVYFRRDGDMPESVELELTVPAAFDELSPRQFGTRLAKVLKVREAELVAEREAEGKTFLGASAVLAQSPFNRPKSEPQDGEVNPTLACRDKWRRIEALRRVKEFLDAYRRSWSDFKQGLKDVTFPAGTYWMCRHAGCATVPI